MPATQHLPVEGSKHQEPDKSGKKEPSDPGEPRRWLWVGRSGV